MPAIHPPSSTMAEPKRPLTIAAATSVSWVSSVVV